MGELVDVRREGAIARVVMHRGGNNAVAEDLIEELATVFQELGSDSAVRVIVLSSEYEKYFSVGMDLGAALAGFDRDAPDAVDRIRTFMEGINRRLLAIEECPKPVIAAINGHALGAGSELALCCDFRIMVEDGRSRIGQTEASLGLMPGAGGTQRLPRLLGKRAARYLIEGSRLSAQEAERVGWVDRAVPPEEFQSAVDELAARLARAATFAIAMTKDAVNRGLDVPLEEGLRIEAANFARVALSADAAIGIMSFLSKQEPEFTGS